jgi:hypothetical protein
MVYNITAILWLQLMVHIVQYDCLVQLLDFVLSIMLVRYSLNNFQMV